MSRDDEWIEPEDAGLRLLLFLADDGEPEGLAEVLSSGVFAGVVARGSRERLAGLLRTCRAAPCALLAAGDIELALSAGLDGVHVGASGVAEARRRLGEGRLVGAEAHGSRHEAMVAGEAGADYVSFRAGTLDRLVELVGWWSEISVLPCAAAGSMTPDMVLPLAEAGAGLFGVGPSTSMADLGRLVEAVQAAEASIRNGR